MNGLPLSEAMPIRDGCRGIGLLIHSKSFPMRSVGNFPCSRSAVKRIQPSENAKTEHRTPKLRKVLRAFIGGRSRYITAMPSNTDFPASGKIIRVEDSFVVFTPANTNYEIKLITKVRYDGPVDWLIEGLIVATARKIWTVASGGNFVAPIFGPPRIVQGRIKFLDQTSMVVQAGVPIVVTLPATDSAYDLNSGAMSIGTLVNATILPGAGFELVTVTAQ